MDKIKIQCTEEQLDIIVSSFMYLNPLTLVRLGVSLIGCSGDDDVKERIRAIFERVDSIPRWRAGIAEEYFYIREDGTVCQAKEHFNYAADSVRYRSGNYFRTKEQAEEYAKKWREIFAANS